MYFYSELGVKMFRQMLCGIDRTVLSSRTSETEILRFRPDRDQYPPFRQPDRGFSGGEQQLRCPDRNLGRERLSAGYGRRNQEGHFSFMRERAFLDT